MSENDRLFDGYATKRGSRAYLYRDIDNRSNEKNTSQFAEVLGEGDPIKATISGRQRINLSVIGTALAFFAWLLILATKMMAEEVGQDIPAPIVAIPGFVLVGAAVALYAKRDVRKARYFAISVSFSFVLVPVIGWFSFISIFE